MCVGASYLLAGVALVFRNDLVHGGDRVLGCVLVKRHRPPGRKLDLKAKFEGGPLWRTFKRLVPNGFKLHYPTRVFALVRPGLLAGETVEVLLYQR